VDVGKRLKVPGEDGLVDDVPHNEGNCMVATTPLLVSQDDVGVWPEQYDLGGAPARDPGDVYAHAILVDSVGPPSAEVCRTTTSFP
jgi:hypothetical protein